MAPAYWILAVAVIWSRACMPANGNAAVSHSASSGLPFFKITGRDFLNTQLSRICLLARMNASISLTKSGQSPVQLAVPQSASTVGSFCDYDFQSLLKLHFSGVTMWMYFTRTRVVAVAAQNQYCLRCDTGNWKISNITVEVSNVTASFHASGAHLPPTKIVGHADVMPMSSGPLYSNGVSVQRSYRCNTTVLVVPLTLTTSLDYHTNTTAAWSGSIVFESLELEPFLVTKPLHVGADPSFKDPLLCTQVTVFHVLVILLPIIYFIIFVVVCRVREKYGCPPDFKKKNDKELLVNEETTKKPLTTSSSTAPPPPVQGKRNILITVTDPDNTRSSAV